jgi:hypothetical protein
MLDLVFLHSLLHLLNTADVPSLLILFTLMMEALYSSKTSFLQETHGITSKKTAFFKMRTVLNVQDDTVWCESFYETVDLY